MPRQILVGESKSETNVRLSVAPRTESEQKAELRQQQVNKMMLDRLLRKPRSEEYMNAMKKLDAGGHVCNQKQVEKIIAAIKNEFPEIEVAGVMLGTVAVCYLGVPYEVHTLDLAGGIITHYKKGEALPAGMEKARSLAMRGGYAFVEVYLDCCRAVSGNGTVSVIPC